jgi:hypothetical protein
VKAFIFKKMKDIGSQKKENENFKEAPEQQCKTRDLSGCTLLVKTP